MSRAKFKAFVKNKDSLASIEEFAKKSSYPDGAVNKGDIKSACEAFEDDRTPEFLLVEVAGKQAQKAFDELDKLANLCEPDTKVIISGDIDELSFYKELIGMGVYEYLLNPIKPEQLERTFSKKSSPAAEGAAAEEAAPREDSKVIVVIGTRSGAGASTLAVNLAGIFASREYPTAIVDLDPEFGSIPLMVDVEPSRGLVDALEKPERVDSLFLDRVMTKVNDSLFVMGAEKNLQEKLKISDEAPEKVVKQLRAKFAYVIVDLPNIDHFAHGVLQNYDVLAVTELSLGGLRDAMRITDLVEDTLKNKDIKFIANKVGLNKKFETQQKDFEEGLGKKLEALLPFEQDIYGYNDSGKILALEEKTKSKFIDGIKEVAADYMPEAVGVKKDDKKKKGGLFGGMMGKK